MASLGKILLYLVATVLIAALLSPPLYWALHGTLDFPFPRYFSRAAQVTAILLLVPLLLWLRIRSVREFGLERNPHAWRDLLAGVGAALVPFALVATGYLAFGVYRLKAEHLLEVLARIALTAGVVACVEEFLFRGVLLGLCARTLGPWPAAVAVSAIFAGVHFLRPGKEAPASVEWWTGFAQVGAFASAAPPAPLLISGLLSLFLAGLILALAVLRTRSLWMAIGLHAGWIFGQQGFQWMARYRVRPPEALWPWVGPNVVSGAVPTGIVSLIALLLTAAGVWLYVRSAARARP